MRVWRLDTLEPEHTLKQPAWVDVLSLFGLASEVWGGVGKQLVVWGRYVLCAVDMATAC